MINIVIFLFIFLFNKKECWNNSLMLFFFLAVGWSWVKKDQNIACFNYLFVIVSYNKIKINPKMVAWTMIHAFKKSIQLATY